MSGKGSRHLQGRSRAKKKAGKKKKRTEASPAQLSIPQEVRQKNVKGGEFADERVGLKDSNDERRMPVKSSRIAGRQKGFLKEKGKVPPATGKKSKKGLLRPGEKTWVTSIEQTGWERNGKDP